MSYQLNAAPISAPPPPLPTLCPLSGKYITLEPLTDCASAFAELYDASHGDTARESVWDYLPYGPFPDSEAMQACYRDMVTDSDPQFYLVRQNTDGTAGGIVSYLRRQPEAYSIEIGHIWHAQSHQRTYANTEAAYLLLDNAFALGYRRLEWKCNALNSRSRQAALRLGFAFEGIFRQHTVFKRRNRDTAWFALIDSDWAAARQNFQHWLAAPGSCSLTALNQPLVQWSLPAHDAYC